MATPLYVNPAAADDTGDGTTAVLAKKTIEAAYAAVDDGGSVYLLAGTYDTTTQGANWYLDFDNNKSVTIKPDPATAPTIDLATAGASNPATCLYFETLDAGKTVRVEGVSISPTTGSRFASCAAGFLGAAELVDCTITAGARNWSFTDTVAETKTREVLVSGCTITNSADGIIEAVVGCARVVVEDCTITNTGTGVSALYGCVRITGGTNQIALKRNTVTTTIPFTVIDTDSITGVCLIESNTIACQLNGSDGNAIRIRTDAAPSVEPHIQVIGNRITKTGTQGICYGVTCESTVGQLYVGYNEFTGFFAAVKATDIDNVNVDSNYFECGGHGVELNAGSGHRIVHNHCRPQDYDGATVGRAVLFQRSVKATSTSTTTFDGTTCTDAGATPWGATEAAVAAGMIAMVNSGTAWYAPLQWGRVVSINADTNVLTVDGWVTFDADMTAETPTNGHVCKIMSFPTGCTITDNVFDCGNASYGVNYDYIPIDPDCYCDRNLWRAGTVNIGLLASHLLESGSPTNLATLREAWAAISELHADNDANSQEFSYDSSRYIGTTRWWRMPGWTQRIHDRRMLRP